MGNHGSSQAPHTVGVKSASGENSQDEDRETEAERKWGLTVAGGASVSAEDEGRGESRVSLARGVDVQLALEDVVDDWLGQVIHDMAVPMLQGQPAGEGTAVRWTPMPKKVHHPGLPSAFRKGSTGAPPPPSTLPAAFAWVE